MTSIAVVIRQRWLSQRAAARYMGVSISFFRENVHVQPKPVMQPIPGKKSLFRYDVDELDAWVLACASVKAAPPAPHRRAS